jgi:hypothetical protein
MTFYITDVRKKVRYCTYINVYRILLEKSVRKSPPLGNPRHTSEDNIKMDLTEISCADENLIQLAEERVH